MYQVIKVNKDGTQGAPFLLSLEGLNMLLNMATPYKYSFLIQRIADS